MAFTKTVESWNVDPKRYGVKTDLKRIVQMLIVIRDERGRFHGATNFRMK